MRVRVSAVFEQENKILCMKYVYGGKEIFSIPGGGVEKDIPLHDALADEWKTELGVKLDVGDIIMVGEAPSDKRHPQTLHIIFSASEIYGSPKIRPESTHSLAVAWLPIHELNTSPLYPDIGKQLDEYFRNGRQRSVAFIKNCMERGFW
jgi:8-oxo-dGTP diphosphatase